MAVRKACHLNPCRMPKCPSLDPPVPPCAVSPTCSHWRPLLHGNKVHGASKSYQKIDFILFFGLLLPSSFLTEIKILIRLKNECRKMGLFFSVHIFIFGLVLSVVVHRLDFVIPVHRGLLGRRRRLLGRSFLHQSYRERCRTTSGEPVEIRRSKDPTRSATHNMNHTKKDFVESSFAICCYTFHPSCESTRVSCWT